VSDNRSAEKRRLINKDKRKTGRGGRMLDEAAEGVKISHLGADPSHSYKGDYFPGARWQKIMIKKLSYYEERSRREPE